MPFYQIRVLTALAAEDALGKLGIALLAPVISVEVGLTTARTWYEHMAGFFANRSPFELVAVGARSHDDLETRTAYRALFSILGGYVFCTLWDDGLSCLGCDIPCGPDDLLGLGLEADSGFLCKPARHERPFFVIHCTNFHAVVNEKDQKH
jgi:hypothetical protein